MKKFLPITNLIVMIIAMSSLTTGCNFPGSSSDDDDDPYYPEYTYVSGRASDKSGQNWTIVIGYQCAEDPSEVGVVVMRENTEVRRVIAKKSGSAYPPEGNLELDFSWQTGEQGCTVFPFVSTSTEGEIFGDVLYLPFGVVINSLNMQSTGDGSFNIAIDYFCDCNINEGIITIYDKDNIMVSEIGFWINGYGGDQNVEVPFNAFDFGLMPKTEYHVVVTLSSEYNTASSECDFATPARQPYMGDNNPPEV